MDQAAAPDRLSAAPLSARARLRVTYLIEGILSFAANLLFIGVFFYTTYVFHWDLARNFLLAAAQGVVYIGAALCSQKLAKRVGGRRLLIVSNLALAGVGAVGVLSSNQVVLIAAIVAYVPLMALNWPVLESAAVEGANAHEMSRRIGAYNLIWAGTGALAVALQGTFLRIDPRMVFAVPLLVHLAVAGVIAMSKGYGDAAPASEAASSAHPQPEPGLLAQRTTALWLSRIALPSTYVVVYSLSALMPLLPVMKRLDPMAQTLVGSAWMAGRWGTFFLLGSTVFWHTRPRLLLWAAAAMGVSFVLITLPLGIPAMVLAGLTLGMSLGLIYTASLYFGMVLSEGSAEHAGYHEALVGLGQVLGPGAGALTQWRWPGSLAAGVVAVSGLICVSFVAAVVASVKARRRG